MNAVKDAAALHLDPIFAYAEDFADAPPEERPLDGFDEGEASKRCELYRERLLEISQKASDLSVAAAFACVEIMDVVYSELIRRGLTQTDGEYGPDVCLTSKGHGRAVQYAILEDRGLLSETDLSDFCSPGALATARGCGLPRAVSLAHGEQANERNGRVFLLLDGGECQDGSTWEAAMSAGELGLDNLIVFIDRNAFCGIQMLSDSRRELPSLVEKFRAFGWEAIETPGHDAAAIRDAFLSRDGDRPLAVICDTVVGRGVDFMENAPTWRHRAPNAEEFAWALDSLKEVRA